METQKYFNFCENYNNKLSNHVFTTIRSSSSVMEKDIRIGDVVEIRLCGNYAFYAKVIYMYLMDIHKPSQSEMQLMYIDTGKSGGDAIEFLESTIDSRYGVLVTLESVDF